ncbi:MAG TPA: triose-phosphate isomerase [Candidatus Obscuribacterales bacterium]
MRKVMIAGNWKMNMTTSEAKELTAALLKGVHGQHELPEVVISPPFTSLQAVVELTKDSHIKVGAQNMDYRESGAFTGEISPLMLLDLGVKYVIIGHSERRQFFGETNESVNLKLKSALKHHLIPIVCVGETLDQREANHTDSVVSTQMTAALADLSENQLKPLVVAYEPVWAIGTGKVCAASEASRVIKVIRQAINSVHAGLGDHVPVLYGGSVNSKNIEEQLAQPDIDGGLIGGASLKADEFLTLIKAGAKRKQLTTHHR